MSRFLKKAHIEGNFRGLPILEVMVVTHLLFVDDILIFGDGFRWDLNQLCQGLDLFKQASGIVVNEEKYIVTWATLEAQEV